MGTVAITHTGNRLAEVHMATLDASCAITGEQPVADAGHGAWCLSLLSHFPLDLVLYFRYTTLVSGKLWR